MVGSYSVPGCHFVHSPWAIVSTANSRDRPRYSPEIRQQPAHLKSMPVRIVPTSLAKPALVCNDPPLPVSVNSGNLPELRQQAAAGKYQMLAGPSNRVHDLNGPTRRRFQFPLVARTDWSGRAILVSTIASAEGTKPPSSGSGANETSSL